MGSLANMLFTMLLGWIQIIVSSVWSAFTSEKGGLVLKWIGNHWLLLAVILCAAGVTADLTIYMLRWRPFHVWKSFFTRRKKGKEEEEPEEDAGSPEKETSKPGRYFRSAKPHTENDASEPSGQDYAPAAPAKPGKQYTEEEDFARWQEEKTEPQREVPGARTIITPAGYTVPEDSPYRRPAHEEPEYREVPDSPRDFDSPSVRNEQGTVMVRRRRRLRVGDLFNDPEEELREFDAPQHLIDRNQAYHKPVYPRGWQKSGEDGE